MRRIGILMATGDNSVGHEFLNTLKEGLQNLGWIEDRNVQMDTRWSLDTDHLRAYATELVASRPDVIVAGATSALVPLQQTTRTIPIVFAEVSDPLHGGFVENLAHPGGNITGFALYEYRIGVKWLELLNQLAPRVNRVAVILDPDNRSSIGQFPETEARAPSVGIRVSALPVRDATEIERAIATFAQEPDGGLIVLPNPVTVGNHQLIAALAAKHHLPDVYAYRFHVLDGGLASYGVDVSDLYRRAASYVARILNGETAGNLPVQFADKFKLVINVKTATMLGLDVPPVLLTRADEVIE
jgi:putative ABC transport system substrate-binding protein